MRVFASPAELADAVGTSLGVSRWHAVDQDCIDAFAELVGDRQWIHVDPGRAATGPFGATIAHGYLLLSLITPMLTEILRVEGATMAVNKGVDRLRFRAAVPAGARVRAAASVASVTPGLRGFVDVVLGVTVEVEGARVPAYTVDHHTLYQTARP